MLVAMDSCFTEIEYLRLSSVAVAASVGSYLNRLSFPQTKNNSESIMLKNYVC